MISNAFKSSYTDKVQAENKVAGTRQAGIKDAGSLAASIALTTIGMNEAMADDGMAELGKVSQYGASRLGGIGGRLVSAIIGEKSQAAKSNTSAKAIINKQNTKELGTVYSKLLNSQGDIETSLGAIDPTTTLGKKIVEQLRKEELGKEA